MVTERASSADDCARAAPSARGVAFPWPPPPPPPIRGPSGRRLRSRARGPYRPDRGRVTGDRAHRRPASRRRPVHLARRERRDGCSAVRIRCGVGDVGDPLGAVHRPTPAMGGSTCAVHGLGRSSPDRIRQLIAGGAELGMATGAAGAGDLDVRPGPPTAAQPKRTLAAVPGVRGVGCCLGRRRLPDRSRTRRTPTRTRCRVS